MRVILVPVADRPECAKALNTAFDLGKRLDASVSGCHIRPHKYSTVELSSEFAAVAWRKKATKKAPVAAKALYQSIAERHGYEILRRPSTRTGALWSEKVGSPDKIMHIIGPVSDLIVVSRPQRPDGISVFEGGGRRDPVGKIVHARLSNKLERLECFFISMLMK